MKRLRANLSKKLKGNAGESLAEVLIALLIAALALTMLASVISSAARMITQSKDTMAKYYMANDALTTHKTNAESATVIDSGELKLTIKQKVGDNYTAANLISSTENKSLPVQYFVNKVLDVKKADGSTTNVVAFWLKP